MRAVLLLAWACFPLLVQSQVALKNNLLYDTSTTPNVSLEVGLAHKWTADLTFGLNPWTFTRNGEDAFVRHWLLQPEARYWFCQRWDGWFLAGHLMGGEFNAGNVRLPFGIAPKLRDYRYEGWYVGGGVGIGYQWPITRHFSIETEVAVGYDYIHYRKYPCAHCGHKLEDGHTHYVGPTKVAVNLVWNLGGHTPSPKDERGAYSYASENLMASSSGISPEKGDGSETILASHVAISNTTLTAIPVLSGTSPLLLSMSVRLDSLRLRGNQTVVLRPVLRSADGQHIARFRPLMLNSHNQHILYERGLIAPYAVHDETSTHATESAIEVQRHTGTTQTVSYRAELPYEPWMEAYSLDIEEDLCGCGDLIADNVTSLLTYTPTSDPQDLISLVGLEPAPDKPSQQLHGTAYVTFVVNKWELRPDYMNNPAELRKITDTLDIMVADRNITVERIKIHGWASPESPYSHNEMLATNRARSLTEWVRRQYQLPADIFAPAEATPENWQGLRQAVAVMGSDLLPHRDEILAIIDDPALQPDPREARIRQRYSQEYQMLLRDVYPTLRRSDYEITFNVRQFNTLDECLDIYRTKPNQLSQHELWRVAQTFEAYSDDYNRAVQTAYNLYPQSEVTALNLANVALRQGDLLKAETLLRQAGTTAQAENARAVLAILRQQYDEAARHLDSATQGGLDVSKNRDAIRKLAPKR